MMLTLSYVNGVLEDEADSWAALHEWVLREDRYRGSFPEEVPEEVSLTTMIAARDAGDICHVCGQVVTWVEHLPPLNAGGPVRCWVNVRSLDPWSVKV